VLRNCLTARRKPGSSASSDAPCLHVKLSLAVFLCVLHGLCPDLAVFSNLTRTFVLIVRSCATAWRRSSLTGP
jgi:hypothetical protein